MKSLQFTRASGATIDTIYEKNDIIHSHIHQMNMQVRGMKHQMIQANKFLVYSYFDNKPNLSVYDGKKAVANAPANVNDSAGNGTNPAGNKIMYSTTENTLRIYFDTLEANAATPIFAANGKIRLSGNFDASETAQAQYLNGREFTISSVQYTDPTSNSTNGYIQINTTGLGFPDADFNVINTTGPNLQVAYSPSSNVEAFFEGAQNVYEDAPVNFASKKIVLREIWHR